MAVNAKMRPVGGGRILELPSAGARLELRDDFTAEIEAGMKDIAKVVAQVSSSCHYSHLLKSFLSETNANRRKLDIRQPSGIA